ncbi:CoA transferase [Pusillimonas sp. TS35]|uniref:CaiB/BaiF CoA transferase family protein n=1 Tax=Paracandidimonas lactea TaxID=2895524 RepID=UPI001371559B|nr:CoA transferase [Pusillimonas sp. TS35]
MTTGALQGLRVVDVSNFVFGPVATQMLGDMGADVIKIEPPEGDPTRGIGERKSGKMGSFFLNLNRNKRSVVLDLKQPDAQAVLDRLLASADVFVHNMRSGAAARLGLDYARLGAKYPRLVHASAQGFGAGGRYFDRPAYDDVIQGLSGIAGLNQRAHGVPAYAPMLLTDKLCGVFLYSAIVTALLHRERSGKGQEVVVPMLESMVAFNMLEHMADGVFPAPPGQEPALGYPRAFSPNHRPFDTRDGAICIIANTDAQWRRLFAMLSLDALADDARFATIGSRMTNLDALHAQMQPRLMTDTTAAWLSKCEQADIPAGPINDLEAVWHDPHLADCGFFRTVEHRTEGALHMPDVAMRLSASPGGIRLAPPLLGEHTAQVLRELGYSQEDAARFAS